MVRATSFAERLPRLELRFGRHRLAAWSGLGRAGAIAGATVFAFACAAAGVAGLLIAAVISACVATFVVARAIGRRWRRGQYVLLELALLSWVTTVAVTAALGGPMTIVLDRWVVALATCLAIGRLGCLCHGCCHGQAARRGVRHPWLPPWLPGSQWEALRLFPLQAVEAGVLAALAILGAWIMSRAPGAAIELVSAGYAIARFEIERWRGDARRYIGPLSHSQWLCIALGTAITALCDHGVGAPALATMALFLAARARRLARPIAVASPRELAELERAADQALAGATAFAGAMVLEPGPHGVRVCAGTSSLSREAARALSQVIAARGGVRS